MQGINPISGGAVQPQQSVQAQASQISPNAGSPAQASGGQSATHAAAGAASSTSMVAHSSTTATFINQQVDMMLANVGQGSQDQQALRMLITLLILQSMFGDQQNNSVSSAAQLLSQIGGNGGNGGGGGGGGGATLATLSSQSTMMQVHQEQTLAYSHQAVQGASVSQYANGVNGHHPGQSSVGGVDLTA